MPRKTLSLVAVLQIMLLIGACASQHPETSSTPTSAPTSSPTRTEAAAIAKRVADAERMEPGYVLAAGSRLDRGGWSFFGKWPGDRTEGHHFFVFVFDDGTTELHRGL